MFRHLRPLIRRLAGSFNVVLSSPPAKGLHAVAVAKCQASPSADRGGAGKHSRRPPSACLWAHNTPFISCPFPYCSASAIYPTPPSRHGLSAPASSGDVGRTARHQSRTPSALQDRLLHLDLRVLDVLGTCALRLPRIYGALTNLYALTGELP